MRPPVPAPSALIVVRPPKNQKCSPSPGPRAMGARAPSGAVVVSAALMEDMRESLTSATADNHPPRAGIFLARRGRLARMGGKVARLIEDIDLLGAQGLPREEFFAELSPR